MTDPQSTKRNLPLGADANATDRESGADADGRVKQNILDMSTVRVESSPAATSSQAPADDEWSLKLAAELAASGLHIRCPHCRNQVEFLEEHEKDDITCRTCGSIFSIVSADDGTRGSAPLKTVGHFELVARAGVGAFGAVWKAYDSELDRTVAVKIPRRGQLDPVSETQFLREARVAAQLRHSNIVSVHEVGREGDTLYIVSDFIRGVTLNEFLTARPLLHAETLALCIKVARALHHAHEHGVVHRDLKPSNIMIDEQHEPHLTDFGLAKRDAGELTMTADGQILGTPAYMSPEQAAGDAHHVDRRTDVYSLGAVLFELLTGELPFRGSAQMQIQQKLTNDPPNPRTLDRSIHRDLATVCLKCVQREPGRRYATAEALAADLERYRDGEPIRARPISWLERVIRWTRRYPAPAACAALVATLAIGGPVAALRIDALRRHSDDLLVQKNLLIEDRDKIIDDDEVRIAALERSKLQLETKLAAWERGADPSEFWPPYETRPAYEKILRLLVADEEYAKQILAQAATDHARAQAHLALAAAHDGLKHREQALHHYRAAFEVLSGLSAESAAPTRYADAKADCMLRMFALQIPVDRAAAIESLRRAQATQQNLAENGDRLEAQAALLDAEQRLAVATGREAAADSLRRAQAIHEQLAASKPTRPQELYELACFLTGRPALLGDDSD